MRKIKLTKNHCTTVDEEDFCELNKYKWYSQFSSKNKHYAVRSKRIGPRKENKALRIYLHRWIMKAKKNEYVDHINGNSLDNRKINLRICTNTQNSQNSPGQLLQRKYGKYKGTKKNKNCKTWSARITVNGCVIYLGCFKNEKLAARAYNKAAKKYFKEFAYLNRVCK